MGIAAVFCHGEISDQFSDGAGGVYPGFHSVVWDGEKNLSEISGGSVDFSEIRIILLKKAFSNDRIVKRSRRASADGGCFL